ncbi:hypothetical protein Droror1_Dr00026663 [Drosera rotundifolia]
MKAYSSSPGDELSFGRYLATGELEGDKAAMVGGVIPGGGDETRRSGVGFLERCGVARCALLVVRRFCRTMENEAARVCACSIEKGFEYFLEFDLASIRAGVRLKSLE